MLNTYKAVLKGDRLEWLEEGPELASQEQEIHVHVTILDDAQLKADRSTQGQQMADVLERLAARNALAHIPDPTTWQREVRQDHDLPGRES